jgi:hypothetical protein
MSLFRRPKPDPEKLRAAKDVDGLLNLYGENPDSRSQVVRMLAELLEEGGNYSAAEFKQRAARALGNLGHYEVLLDFLARYADNKDERGGLGYLSVFNVACAEALRSKSMSAIKRLLLIGPFEYREVQAEGVYKLVDCLVSEDDVLDVYLTTRSSQARQWSCSRLGHIGGAKSRMLLETVAEKGLKLAFDELGRTDASDAVQNTWVAMGGAGVFKLYGQRLFHNDFEKGFKNDAQAALTTIRKRI